jgi:hypothetical protein
MLATRAVLLVVGLSTFAMGSASTGLDCPLVQLPSQAEQAAAVDAAGIDLALVPVPGLDPGSAPETHACGGEIRPGAHMTTVGCTMSWIFRDDAGSYYQSTAGHCTNATGDRVAVAGVGTIGTVVFRVNGGIGNDISIIRIDPVVADKVNPTLCHWGGPTGIAAPEGATLDGQSATLHYGWGTAFANQPTRARAGVLPATGWLADGSVHMMGLTDGGDSGSPVMLDNGLAAGVHTHRIITQYAGEKAATRLDMMMPRVDADLGTHLTLVTGLPVDLTGSSIP